MTPDERCAWLQQQVADRDRFIEIDRVTIERLRADLDLAQECLRDQQAMLATAKEGLRKISYLHYGANMADGQAFLDELEQIVDSTLAAIAPDD